MALEEFKKNCDEATDFIISCWDENNEGDGKTFDQRIQERIGDLKPEVRSIVEGVMDD